MTDEPYMKYDPLSDTFHFHTEDQDTELSFDDDGPWAAPRPPDQNRVLRAKLRAAYRRR